VDAAVFDFCAELLSRSGVSDTTYKKARNLLSEREILDLTGIVGSTSSVIMLLNTANMD
jgi:hypothetical protein